MKPLRSVLEFDTLPSERNEGRNGRVSRAMHRLIETACCIGPNSCSNPGDLARRNSERMHSKIPIRHEGPLSREEQPGWLVARQDEETREILRQLRDVDVAQIEVPMYEVHDYTRYGQGPKVFTIRRGDVG